MSRLKEQREGQVIGPGFSQGQVIRALEAESKGPQTKRKERKKKNFADSNTPPASIQKKETHWPEVPSTNDKYRRESQQHTRILLSIEQQQTCTAKMPGLFNALTASATHRRSPERHQTESQSITECEHDPRHTLTPISTREASTLCPPRQQQHTHDTTKKAKPRESQNNETTTQDTHSQSNLPYRLAPSKPT